ncbi:helix-turn-helix domain-containing protein [Streptomyces sp. NPDC058471]|uniref:helix-turn-helix domain-containing protein n=1 Tax=Streptomyces sp. NPDC058471 TaxID=3346516 RepID=UPI00364A69C4
MLSTYNTGPLCGCCQAKGWLPEHVWDEPRILQALADFDLGTAIKLIRGLTGVSQGEVAAHTGLSQGDVSKLESGRRLTKLDTTIRVLEGLGVPADISPIRTPGTPSPAGVPAAPQWDDPLDIAADVGEALTSNTAPAAIQAADNALLHIIDAYEADGPTGEQNLADKTRKLRARAHQLLRGQQPASHRIALFRMASRTSAVLGYMAVNAGRHTLAESYCAEAIALAEDIGDLETIMWAHGTRSLSAYYRGDFGAAATYAKAGIDLAPQHPQAIRLNANGLARALARQHDATGAMRAIGDAEELSARHQVTSALTPCIALEPYGVTRTLANAITGFVALGDTDAVLRYEDEISSHVAASTSDWTRSLVRLDVATVLVTGRRPDIEHAMLLGQQVLRDAADGPLILSVVQRAHDLRRSAAQWNDVSVVREYSDILTAWSATPRVQQLSGSATMPGTARTSGRTPPGNGNADDAPRRIPAQPPTRP